MVMFGGGLLMISYDEGLRRKKTVRAMNGESKMKVFFMA